MIRLTRLVWYVFHWLLYAAYSFVHFFAKPGARVILPLTFIAGAIWIGISVQSPHGNPWPVYVFLSVICLIFSWLYPKLSHGLAVLMGAFPPIRRPLPPKRQVKAARKKKELKPAVVRQVVPALKKRRPEMLTIAVPVQSARIEPLTKIILPVTTIPAAKLPVVATVPPALVQIVVPPLRPEGSFVSCRAMPAIAGR